MLINGVEGVLESFANLLIHELLTDYNLCIFLDFLNSGYETMLKPILKLKVYFNNGRLTSLRTNHLQIIPNFQKYTCIEYFPCTNFDIP